MTQCIKTSKKPSIFIQKLYQILQEPSYASVICWSPHDEIVIKDIEKLKVEILGTCFRHQKYESFVRQLNMYGFEKMSKSDKHTIYFKNANFQKNKEWKLVLIKRKTSEVKVVKGQQVKCEQNQKLKRLKSKVKADVSTIKQIVDSIKSKCTQIEDFDTVDNILTAFRQQNINQKQIDLKQTNESATIENNTFFQYANFGMADDLQQ